LAERLANIEALIGSKTAATVLRALEDKARRAHPYSGPVPELRRLPEPGPFANPPVSAMVDLVDTFQAWEDLEGVVDDRVLGTEEAKKTLYRCTVPDCGQEFEDTVVPDCPDHDIPMEPVNPPPP
jgi:hypothetical protein